MEAIILAAGRGNRLRQFNPDGRPKCLLEFNGQSLLSRQLASLARCGISRVEVVVGYEADQIIEHVGKLSERPEVSFSFNPRFLEGSSISLLSAAATLNSGRPALVLDADVLFHEDILRQLVNSSHENCFLLDRDFVPGDEPVKIAVTGDHMVEFRKVLAADLKYDTLGESVGFFRFDSKTCKEIAHRCADYDRQGRGDQPHEEVLRDTLLNDPDRFGFEDVSGLPWLEIDFPQDLERAVKDILPALPGEQVYERAHH